MKNQYIGDIGDYGKYGLLRFLRDQGIRIGVNWYMTPGDGKTDGKHTEYLEAPQMRAYDPDLFDVMETIALQKDKDISQIEESGILNGLHFHSAMMDYEQLSWRIRACKRAEWHQKAMDHLKEAELVFADPDNGLSSRIKPTMKDAQKFILPGEIADYFERGQQVVYYQHRPRKNETEWMKVKTQIREYLPEARLLAVSFNRWSCRTYIFVLHPEVCADYRGRIGAFLQSVWGTYLINHRPAFVSEKV